MYIHNALCRLIVQFSFHSNEIMWKVELNKKKATGTFTDAQGLTAFLYVAVTIRTMSGGHTAREKDEEAAKSKKKGEKGCRSEREGVYRTYLFKLTMAQGMPVGVLKAGSSFSASWTAFTLKT